MKYLSMAILALVGVIMAGCSADDSIASEQQPDNGSRTITLKTTVRLGGGNTTRALDSKGHRTFAPGEQITFRYETNTVHEDDEYWSVAVSEPLKASDIFDNGKSATVTVTLTDADPDGGGFCYYPAPLGKPETESMKGFSNYWSPLQQSQKGQDGTLEYIAANLDGGEDVFKLENGEISSIKLEDLFYAVFAFSLKNEDGTEDLTSTVKQLTVKAGDNTYTINRKQPYGDTIYFAMHGYENVNIKYTATADDGITTYTKEVTGKTYESGHFYALGLQMTPTPITDLSMVNTAGEPINGMTTANCYMVHEAGAYKLPLVYGNAIKGGQTNEVAYNPGGTTSTYYLANFNNHADKFITDPWIKNNKDESDNNITVTSAELLWQDAQGLITAVGINGDYLTLNVGKNASEQEGNALVAAKDANGNIVWSWHIWVTKQTFSNLTDFNDVTNNTSYTYKVTPVNLGWVGDATSTTGYNTFYQWGRKDAFLVSTGEDSPKYHAVYDINNNKVEGISYTNNSILFGSNIQNPTVFNTSPTGNPISAQFNNLWDAQLESGATVVGATVKTIYDPCPPGFCVPTIGLYSYIKGLPAPNWSPGRIYNEVLFPASGCISTFANSNHYSGSGYYWSATPVVSTTTTKSLSFFLGNLQLCEDLRGAGFSVRAVAEEEYNNPNSTLTGTLGNQPGSYTFHDKLPF